jgi:hypothetical protein
MSYRGSRVLITGSSVVGRNWRSLVEAGASVTLLDSMLPLYEATSSTSSRSATRFESHSPTFATGS